VSLLFAWRYLRGWFWVLLPFVAGLWLSTIYLRHHYVVDLLAGWALAPVGAWLPPRIDGGWAARPAPVGHSPCHVSRGAVGRGWGGEDGDRARPRGRLRRNGSARGRLPAPSRTASCYLPG